MRTCVLMSIMNLHSQFPGGLMQSSHGYDYFLVGDINQSKNLKFDGAFYQKLEVAILELGKFSSKIREIPNKELFIVAYSNKEATQSSRIEGTQTNIEDAFIHDEDAIVTEKRDDWLEVLYYIEALQEAILELNNLPLCNRFIKQIHKTLLNQPRGHNKSPGNFRTSQNWIGGNSPNNAHFVPPSFEYVDMAMDNLEAFMQNNTIAIPHLIKIALIHYQFETIHPFLDGNGRVGRMLIPLYLLENKILADPILYISDYFEKNRLHYYNALDNARHSQQGLVDWVSFFLDAVYITAKSGMEIAEKILTLKQTIDKKIVTLGRRTAKAGELLMYLFENPVINSKTIREKLNISQTLAQQLLKDFLAFKIVKEVTGNQRNRRFIFFDYIKLLE